MSCCPLLLQIAPDGIDRLQQLVTINLALTGVVGVVVILLWLRLTAEPPETPAPAPGQPGARPAPGPEAGADASTVAAIAAAVHVLLGEPHRILTIRPAETGWSREGRRQIFESHRVR